MATLETHTIEALQPKMFPSDARTMAVSKFTASKTLPKGTTLGKVTATGALEAYNNGAATGVETAVGVLAEDIITDGSGNIFKGDSAVASTLNPPVNSVAMYIAGTFDTADLVGWDAAAATDLKATTLVNGYVRIP